MEMLSEIPITEPLLEFRHSTCGRKNRVPRRGSVSNRLLQRSTMMKKRRSSRRHNEEVDEACIADIASDHEIDVVGDSTDEESEASSDSESEAYWTDNENDLSFSTGDFNWPDDESSISDSSRSGTWTGEESSISDSSRSGT